LTTVIAVASGPSFTEAQAEPIRAAHAAGRVRLLVVNRMWERFPDADVLYGADAKWWRKYWAEVERGFRGECWTCNQEIARQYGLCWIAIADGDVLGLSRDPSIINSGINSGYQAINLAFHFGATRIILAGYDMQHTGGRAHSHDDYPADWSNAGGVKEWVKNYTSLANDLRAANVDVVNCTIDTALRCFPRADLAETLAALESGP
jgi:hypothetical protein